MAAILLGVCLKNFVPSVPVLKMFPFTAVVFGTWTIMSVVNYSGDGLGVLGKSMDMWEAIDPHLMLVSMDEGALEITCVKLKIN